MNRSSRKLRRLGIAIVAVAATIAMSGCGSDEPLRAGTAVIIDGDRITIADLQDKVETIQAERARFGLDPVDGESRQQIQRMIVHRILLKAAAEHDVTVTETEIDEEISQIQEQFGGEDQFAEEVANASIAPDDLRGFVADGILQTKLGEELVPNATTDEQLAQRQEELTQVLTEIAGELDIDINPRYGTFDPNTGLVNPPTDPAVQDSDAG